MKRSNSLVLRLGVTNFWENNIDVMDGDTCTPYLLKSGDFVINYIKAARLNNVIFYSIPLSTMSHVVDRSLIVFFRMCFYNRVIFFFWRKKIVYFNSILFLDRVLKKIEDLFWRNFGIVLFISSSNYHRNLLTNSFLREASVVLSKTSVNDLSVLSNLFLLALYYRDAYFFSHLFSSEIKKKKYHFRTIAKLSEVINSVLLHLTNITCLVVFVSGRLNNKDKSQTKILSFGTKSVLSSFNIDVNYGYSSVVTPIGVFGIRCWMY